MTQSHEFDPNPRQYAEQVLAQSEQILQRAVSIVSPENPEADPLVIFPPPQELRAEDSGFQLSEDQEQQLRSVAAELGFGREADYTLSQQGLYRAHAIIEGGQPHKILAEALLVINDRVAVPSSIIFSASPHRKIKNPAEIASAERLLGSAGKTEYDVARSVIASLPDFEPLQNEEVEAFGYDISNNFAVSNDTTGQLIHEGYLRGVPVRLLRVDREDYEDEDGSQKYRKQPDTAAVIGIVDGQLKMGGNTRSGIVFITSATYELSRTVDAARAALQAGRVVGLATYGTASLANVKGEDIPAPAPINQLPGELHKVAQQIARLREVLET